MSDQSENITKNHQVIQLLNQINQLKNDTLVDQLVEDGFISLQRRSGFTWIELFLQYFTGQDCTSNDDLLFFVRKQASLFNRFGSNLKINLDVYRKDSNKLPLDNAHIDWEETLYINTIMQYFEYTLTCAICTRTSPKEFQILAKHSQKVFASPSHRSMHNKGEIEEITYPDIFFTLDNYEEMMSNIPVRCGEMVCVELVASDRNGEHVSVLFSGSINYETIRYIHELQSGSKVRARRKRPINHYFGNKRMEFIRMKGPRSRGISEMAYRKISETGLSRSGSSVSLHEGDFEMFEHHDLVQRRMSDPSNELEKKLQSWKGKPLSKSRSANQVFNPEEESGINEVEATDFTEEMEEGDYDKLWDIPGFNQAFHFWKENKRASSPTFELFITYITLPFNFIMSDLLSAQQQKPILTF
ncbi:uncharacterized protein KIAA0930 homolog isoform X2 [Panonychus citri]|uniref:uncharacterized protein KIAA0930 homolog isoform X2 n=1 Tax=Panonychus citri TaxID=50023 RepID=UPI0023081E7B|nr:uncharacterized protein KIAA0930 homolog isoform X2 [Panonychus citri]